MNVLLTFDYELFFGARPGTPEKCLVEPVTALLKVLDRHGVKACFFVDAGYLVRLGEECRRFSVLQRDCDLVASHVADLHRQGHDIQLHVHPHWEDTRFEDSGWKADVRRYRLHDFPDGDIPALVRRYRAVLTNLVGDGVVAYRAGGWCLQPFEKIRGALKENGIRLDSTVFAKGFSETASHVYDFRGAESATAWRFGADPLRSDPNGEFVEIPISSTWVGPLFFWRFAAVRALRSGGHRAFGDGAAITAGGRRAVLRMLAFGAYGVVSTDGYKSSLLAKAFRKHRKRFPGEGESFVVIGHPKALTPYSLKQLDRFVEEQVRHHCFVTYRTHPLSSASWV